MANNALDLAGNSYEDFIDEFSSNLIYKSTKKYFAPLLKRYQNGEEVSEMDEAFNEAMQSAITTLQFGISMSATLMVNKYFYEKVIRVGTFLWGYILYGQVLANKKLKNWMKGKKITGKAGLKVFSVAKNFTGGDERGRIAQIANDMTNQHSGNFVEQQKVDLMQKKRFEQPTKDLNQKYLELFTYKTKTGTWKNSAGDKRIFKKATGSELKQGRSYSKIFDELNGFKEFASTSEGEIVNNVQAHLDHLTTLGVEKVR